jgi:hypothetical protein
MPTLVVRLSEDGREIKVPVHHARDDGSDNVIGYDEANSKVAEFKKGTYIRWHVEP